MTTKIAAQLQAADQAEPELLRVLLVDDDASVLRFLMSAFTSSRCQVTTASTAEQALGLLGDDPYDLVVSDIKMPGLSGLDLLRSIKGKRPGTPVVLITGVPSVNSAVFGLRYGAYDYLPKPFSVTEVKELIQRFRRDRAEGNGNVHYPAGLNEELARRQGGVEVLSGIGELALQGLEPGVFVEKVLEKTIQSLRCDGAVILLCDQDGKFNASRMGEPELVNQLLTLLHAHFGEVLKTGGRETFTLTKREHGFEALAALIPGVGNAMGILCMGRDARHGAFLPDEKALLHGYAQTTAIALQKIVLREHLEKNLIDTISSFVIALESKDPYLKGHSTRVSLYTGELASVMGMPPGDVVMFSRAGMLHDLGKLVILDNILRKPRQLTEEEFELIRSHPVVGDKILKPLRFLSCEAKAVRHHHERYDGKGYPDSLKGEDIPLIARVVTVADAFDAMTSDRPYRDRRPLEAAVEEILRGAGTQFDPVAAEAFVTIPIARLEQVSRHFDLRSAEAPVAAAQPLVAH
ncbi:MAG: response regulator [Candidatus Rokubacteria bacterium]|nr:response regulator [Candidatus Rokubacteria bacterium]